MFNTLEDIENFNTQYYELLLIVDAKIKILRYICSGYHIDFRRYHINCIVGFDGKNIQVRYDDKFSKDSEYLSLPYDYLIMDNENIQCTVDKIIEARKIEIEEKETKRNQKNEELRRKRELAQYNRLKKKFEGNE